MPPSLNHHTIRVLPNIIYHTRYIQFIILFLFISLLTPLNSQTSPTYSSTPNGEKLIIKTDTKDAVLALRSSSDPALSFSISYSSTIAPTITAPATTPKLVTVTSVSSFDCLASTEFSFNMSITSPSLSGFTMQFLIFGNTYLNKLRFNYLAAAWDPAYTNALATPPVGLADILYNDCFLTSDLAVVSDKRSQPFQKQVLAGTVTDNSKIKIQSFITGLKFFNNKDVSKKVSVKSQILTGTNYITQTVEVTGNTVLEWICLGTVVIDQTYPEFYQEILPNQVGYFTLDRLSASINMATFPTNYLDKFDKVDNKFFGLIQLELYLGKPYQIIKFLSDNIGTVQLGYESLASGGKMGYFFLAKRECVPNTLLYSLLDFKCYTPPTCPAKTAQDSPLLICAKCHYSCQTCSGLTSSTCSTCNAANFRDTVASGVCKCSSTYVDNGVALCQKCNIFLPFCATCSSTTVCLTCSDGGFVLRSNKTGCDCDPVNYPYYVTASTVCAPFAGCSIALKNPNFTSCTKCDTTQNFKEIPVSGKCVCMTNYVQKLGTCVDNCGDGINPYLNSTTYCDDGNAIADDGCDLTCAIDPLYGCFNPPNVAKSFCSKKAEFTLKFLYVERVISQNAGNFYFQISPSDARFLQAGFTYYVETTIPHTTAIGTYDQATSIVKIKITYLSTIEDQTHDIHVTLDPYVMFVAKQSFSVKSSGVNYDLTIEDSPRINTYLWYMTISVSGIVVITSLVFTFVNYKIAAVQLLLSSQLVYMGLLSWMSNNLSLYPLTGLRYLAGFNTLQMFEINKYNASTPFLLSSYTFAEFLLNLNIMAGIAVLVIFLLIPLKINVWFRNFQRSRFTSPEMQQKLMTEEPTTSLAEMSSKIKTAQLIADTYVDRVYFGFSLIVFLPIVLYFSIQLGFIGKVGRYELSSFANIMLSILLLMLDFCFFILIFQDTDKKLKTFNFGSKKLKSYPNRLMMFYFATCCLFTIVLLSEYTFYVLCGMTLITGIYTFVQNPYERFSLEYFDAVSKPIIALICQIAIKATTLFSKQMIFIPIGIDALLLIGTIVSIVRVARVKASRAQATKKMLQDAENDDDQNGEDDKNVRTTDESQYASAKGNKKINAKLTGSSGNSQGQQKDLNRKDSNSNDNQNDDSAGELNKQDSPNNRNEQELGEQQQDELTRIKRSLRQDLKKRRGVVQKGNGDDNGGKSSKKSKSKKMRGLDFAEDNNKKNE